MADVLRVLPDDERRILQPVVDDPGLTQIEVRDRSEFSKSADCCIGSRRDGRIECTPTTTCATTSDHTVDE